MEQVWFTAALWLFLALGVVLLANLLKVSTALSEIVVGTVAQLLIGATAGGEALGAKAPWIAFLAGAIGHGHFLIRRLRTLTFGLLTPFYFIRARSFVSLLALLAAPFAFVALFAVKMISKLLGLLPVVRRFGYEGHEGVYDSLMMSTGLTLGTILSLFGLNHGIITRPQYSYLVATVIGSAVIPTAIANARFLPRRLLPARATELKQSVFGEPVGDLES